METFLKDPKEPNDVQAIKLVAFDCDGVMFDSVKANTAYYNQVLNRFGRPNLTPEQFAYAHMHTADDAIGFLFPEPEAFKEAQAYRRKMSYIPFIELMEIEPTLRDLLDNLKGGYHTAVATNRTDTMQRVLEIHNLEDAFDLVVSASDVDNPKPHPEQLVKILDHFALRPEQVLYIGDSLVDQLAAEAANTPFVAFRNRELKADFHVLRLQEIEEILTLPRIFSSPQ